QEGGVWPQAVPDAELVEDVRIVDRDIRDHEVGGHELAKHVLADVPLLDDLLGRAALRTDGADTVESRPDQRFLDPVEVHALLRAERTNDEDPLAHVSSSDAGAPSRG